MGWCFLNWREGNRKCQCQSLWNIKTIYPLRIKNYNYVANFFFMVSCTFVNAPDSRQQLNRQGLWCTPCTIQGHSYLSPWRRCKCDPWATSWSRRGPPLRPEAYAVEYQGCQSEKWKFLCWLSLTDKEIFQRQNVREREIKIDNGWIDR